VLIVWAVCVAKNWWTDGAYKIPGEVTSCLMAIVTALFGVPVIERMMRGRGDR
jgi:hypothetical protein